MIMSNIQYMYVYVQQPKFFRQIAGYRVSFIVYIGDLIIGRSMKGGRGLIKLMVARC